MLKVYLVWAQSSARERFFSEFIFSAPDDATKVWFR